MDSLLGSIPRRNVVKVGYGVVAVAAIDGVEACTGFDIVIASAGENYVVSAVCVDVIGAVGSLEQIENVASFDDSHGRVPSWCQVFPWRRPHRRPPRSDVLDAKGTELVL